MQTGSETIFLLCYTLVRTEPGYFDSNITLMSILLYCYTATICRMCCVFIEVHIIQQPNYDVLILCYTYGSALLGIISGWNIFVFINANNIATQL